MKAAELFVKCLENEGVEYIFGVPGEENAHFMMALEDSPIQFIVCRHEQGAAFIADAYGRLTGRPGVCLGTLGPGATNLVTGVANANMDRVPLIVLTGQADSRRQHKESHQNMDVVAMFTPITKWAKPIIHSENIPEAVKMIKAAKKPVILAGNGDGGFLMNVQELETARRIDAGIVVMIWDDQSYGLIEWKQQNTFGRHTDLHFNNPDFIKLAEAFGCKGIRVENSADLHDALVEAFKQEVPVLLSVPVDYRENLKLSERLGNIACPI